MGASAGATRTVPRAASRDDLARPFLLLACLQAAHSAEEYAFRLFESFPPARFVSGLVSSDPELGFVVINVVVVAAAFASWWWPVRRRWRAAAAVAWVWVALEMVNGVGHPAWSVVRGGYTPGVVTALLLLPAAIWLAVRLARGPDAAPVGRPGRSRR